MTKFKHKYSQLSQVELQTEAVQLRGRLARARLDLAAGKLKNSRQVFTLRKQLAVVYSYLRNLPRQ